MAKRKERKIVALIDYENIAKCGVEEGKILDFEKLHHFLIDFGKIISAYVFIPPNRIHSMPNNLNLMGFDIIVCQKTRESSEKLEDSVDINLIQKGMTYIGFSEITDIIIVSNDRHMAHLVKIAKNHKKRIHIIGTKRISYVLKQVVSANDIHELPVK